MSEDRPALTDVEITPAMIEAGVNALRDELGEDERYLGDDARAVCAVFLAMRERAIHLPGRTRLCPSGGSR